MTQLRPLIIIALLANLLTLILYNYVIGVPAGNGMDLLFIIIAMPAIWLTAIIAAIIVLYTKRKSVLQKPILSWTLLTLLFTTPIPVLAIYNLTHPTPATRSDGTEINTVNGKVYKWETWEKTATHKKFADKRFIADSSQEAIYGDKAYKKDSIWVYFDDKGDTSKLEYYKDDSLVMIKQFKTQ